jgi:hypothetical protein
MSTACGRGRVAVAALWVLTAACGQKGPPLAPLHLVPAAATEVSVRRIGDQVRLRFVLPTTNANGPGPVQIDRVEIYSMTVAPGFVPANRLLLTKPYLIGQVAVRPPPVEGEEPKEPKEGDARPAPGDAVFFDDPLTPEKLEPLTSKEPEPPAPPAAATAVPAVAAPPASTDPRRIYVARGVTRSGRAGPTSTRVQVPIVPLPPPPAGITPRVTETSVALEWTPPADAAPAVSFNVFRADEPLQPINPAPLADPSFEYSGVEFGQEYCFRVRSVVVTKDAAIEGDLSEAQCVTPRDVFPPAAPDAPDAVPTPGQISLIWDANTEKDLAGYIVLRGEAPDGTLQALTPAPIRETSYRDATVQPGVRYIYAIVAVDSATPPNTSPQSGRVEETAR